MIDATIVCAHLQAEKRGSQNKTLWRSASKKYEVQLKALDDTGARLTGATLNYYAQVEQYLELPEMLRHAWKERDLKERRELVQILTSNISIKAKKAIVEIIFPFDHFFNNMILKGWYPQGNSKSRSRVYRPLPTSPKT